MSERRVEMKTSAKRVTQVPCWKRLPALMTVHASRARRGLSERQACASVRHLQNPPLRRRLLGSRMGSRRQSAGKGTFDTAIGECINLMNSRWIPRAVAGVNGESLADLLRPCIQGFDRRKGPRPASKWRVLHICMPRLLRVFAGNEHVESANPPARPYRIPHPRQQPEHQDRGRHGQEDCGFRLDEAPEQTDMFDLKPAVIAPSIGVPWSACA